MVFHTELWDKITNHSLLKKIFWYLGIMIGLIIDAFVRAFLILFLFDIWGIPTILIIYLLFTVGLWIYALKISQCQQITTIVKENGSPFLFFLAFFFVLQHLFFCNTESYKNTPDKTQHNI